MRLQARTRGVPTGSGRLLAYDPAVIQHVLAHRPDHAASKFLKKEFRLPKKVCWALALTPVLPVIGQAS